MYTMCEYCFHRVLYKFSLDPIKTLLLGSRNQHNISFVRNACPHFFTKQPDFYYA